MPAISLTSGAAEPRRAQIGPYQLLAKIGEGGMGLVHLAKLDGPAGFNKLAVVKELRADRVDMPQFAQMFLDEARLAGRLTHPNVVHTYGANEAHGRLFLAMEYLDGQPWSRVRRVLWENGSLPLELHIKVLAEALAGLHYAHELRDYDGTPLRVVHCDMSPQNVFVTYDGQVKLVDFGVARGVTRTTRPDPNVIMGKLAFIAPEQARGEEVDRRADIFSVGVMLWEALARRRFAEGTDWAELRKRRVEGAEPRACELGPSVPAALASICDRALALDPNGRYATAAEFREALLSFSAIDLQDAERAQLGELVSRAFSEDRTRIHALIERALKPPEAGSRVEVLPKPPPENQQAEPVEHTVRADLTELASVSRIHNEAAVVEAVSSAQLRLFRKRPHTGLWSSAAAALLVAATWLALRPPSVAPTSMNAITATPLPPAHSEPAPAAPPPPAASIQLVVAATPADAVLLLDGAPLGTNPYAGRVPADRALHVIRAEARGQQSQERVLTFEQDCALSFNLSPLPRLASRARKPAPASAGSASLFPSAGLVDAAAPARMGEPLAPLRPRQRPIDAFDAPLRTESGSRPIYDEDPYR